MSAYRLTLRCTRIEAEAIALAEIDDTVLVTTEEDEAGDVWRLDAYFEGEPDPATLAAVRALVAATGDVVPEPLADEDWVTLSQSGLAPIREGRFVVHTTAHPAEPPEGGHAFLIEAGQAFGTGHHETTSGCLAMLDRLAVDARTFENIVDLGTGTGLLALASARLWPGAYVLATDIDPIAIAVSRQNADLNGITRVAFAVADGALDLPVIERQEFNLLIANILAGPLIEMASEIVGVAAPNATVLLAGLLTSQAGQVEAAYAATGCTTEERLVRGDWTILRLTAGAEPIGPALNRDRQAPARAEKIKPPSSAHNPASLA